MIQKRVTKMNEEHSEIKAKNNRSGSAIALVLSVLIWIPVYTLKIPAVYLSFASLIWVSALLFAVRNTSGIISHVIVFIVLWFSLTAKSFGTYGQNLGEFGPSLLTALCIFPAFLTDGLVTRKNRSFVLTLVFPVLYTFLAYLAARFRINSGLRLDIYMLPFLAPFQLVAVGGSYGFTFLVSWLCSCILFLLISEKKNIKAVAWTCPAALIIIACIFGAIRLGTAKDPDYTFKAAYANGPYRGGFQDEDYDVEYEKMTRYLCDTVSEAKKEGAKFIAYSEEAFGLDADSYDNMITYARSLARENQIDILLGTEKWFDDTDELSENAIRWINSDGEIVMTALKSNLIPNLETRYYKAGKQEVSYVDLMVDGKNVRISMAVCFDGDFSLFTRKMDPETDLFVLPSWDWDTIRMKHYLSAAYIPVQSHVTLFKPTYDGFTFLEDPYGRMVYEEKDEEYLDHQMHIVTIPVYDLK